MRRTFALAPLALAGAFAASLALNVAAQAAPKAPPATPPAAAPDTTAAPPAVVLPKTDAEKTETDVRCVIVAYTLTQSQDADLQKLGAVSLFYFWGRLEGRDALDNMSARLTDTASKMTADDLKAQANICGAIFTAGTESLRTLNNTVQDRTGAAPPPK